MKTTLITCATSHLGSEVVKAFSCDHLIMTGRNTEKLINLSDSLECKTKLVELDFFNIESVNSAAETISSEDKIDKIIFIIPRIPATNKIFPSNEEWSELYSNFFINPLSLLKKLFESDSMNEGAKILFISGLSSKSALTNYASNNCLRNAWLGQAKTMALAFGEQNISINTLSLGGVMTEAYIKKIESKAEMQNVSFEDMMKEEVSNIPMKKYATVDEVVSAIQSLVGPMVAHMTGQNILLDGGFLKGY